MPARLGNPTGGVLQTSIMRTKTDLRRLVQGAMGELKADLIVTGGKLINVYSGEILDGVEIGVLDGRICYVGPSATHGCGAATQTLDAHGLYVSPGFIDGHTHIGHYCRPYEYLQAYVSHGTTALMASGDELATAFGYLGVKLFLGEVKAHPLRVYPLISMVAPQDPLLCSTQSLTQAEVAEGLDDPRVLGLGEVVAWLRLTQCDEELLERIAMAHARRRSFTAPRLAREIGNFAPSRRRCAGATAARLLDHAAGGLLATRFGSNSQAAA
jgi:adenine deaminase